jgi:hypothetical protein
MTTTTTGTDTGSTGINLDDYVIMREARPPKRTGELLKLAARLIGELPAPRTATVYAASQEISLGFDGTRDGLNAMAAWARHYQGQLTGEHVVLEDGTDAVRCDLSFDRDGMHISAYAYVKAATGQTGEPAR